MTFSLHGKYAKVFQLPTELKFEQHIIKYRNDYAVYENLKSSKFEKVLDTLSNYNVKLDFAHSL